MHDGGDGQPTRHHPLVVSSDQALYCKWVFEASALPTPQCIALEVGQTPYAAQVVRVPHTKLVGVMVGMMWVMMLGMWVVRVKDGTTLAGGMLHTGHLEALATTQEAAVLEHVATVRVKCPETALSGLIGAPRDLDEAVVEGEVVAE